MSAHEFEKGDLVWLDVRNIKIHQATPKLGPKRLGPYLVTEKRSALDYELDLSASPGLRIHNVFHVDRLSPWHGNEVNALKPMPPPPIEVEGEEEYEVEAILDSRLFRRQFQYLVWWKGYGTEHNSWEPSKNITHADKEVKKFHEKYPNARQKIAATIFEGIQWKPLKNFTESGTNLEWETGRYLGVGQTIADNGP